MKLADFADLIEKHIEELTAAWVDSVREDARIHSDDDLSPEGLRDHIPALLNEVCGLLRSGEDPTLQNTREARVHAYLRFRQGYRARELVRELSLLRSTLLDQIGVRLLDGPLDENLHGGLDAMRVINLYIDEELSYAVAVYAEAIRTKDPDVAPE
jgi:RsbT co-antagonist protein rsbRD N-terminal domain